MHLQSSESSRISSEGRQSLVFRPMDQREKIAKMRAYFARRKVGVVSFGVMMRTLIQNAELNPSFVGAVTLQRAKESYLRQEENANKKKGSTNLRIKFTGETMAFRPYEVWEKLNKLTEIAISETDDPNINIGTICRALVSMVALDEEFYKQVLERVSTETIENRKTRKPRTPSKRRKSTTSPESSIEPQSLKRRRPTGTRRNRKHGKK